MTGYWNGDAWRWSTDQHRTPGAVTIAVIEPTPEQVEAKADRDDAVKAKPKARRRVVPFGFARALEEGADQ